MRGKRILFCTESSSGESRAFFSCAKVQAAKNPRVSGPEELRALLSQLDRCFRVMVFLDAVCGLRRSELLAPKWSDIDFDELQINVRRSIYLNVVGNCKTEASRKPVPMDFISPLSSGPGSKTVPTDNLMIGCLRALTLAAETPTGRIAYFHTSFALQCVVEFGSTSAGIRSGTVFPPC